jgi:GntR family transcriptional regulator
VPIYRQLKQQIRHAVETGALRPGDTLPPIRTLAEQLVVNVNTIARVYRELEAERLLELRQGVGAFVSDSRNPMAEAETRLMEARGLARDFVRGLQERGLSSDEIRRLLQVIVDELLADASPRALAPTE